MNWPQSRFCKSLFHLVISTWIHFPTFSRLLQNLISKSIQCYIIIVKDRFRSCSRAETIIVKLKASELLQIQDVADFLLVLVLFAQSCPTLCDPMDYSPPGSSVHEIFPGKDTGVGRHFLLQGIFPTQGSNPGLLHCRQILYRLSYKGRFLIIGQQICTQIFTFF